MLGTPTEEVMVPSPMDRERATSAQPLLVACMFCKRVQPEGGAWQAPRAAVPLDSVSHGICPDCFATHYPEFERSADPDAA